MIWKLVETSVQSSNRRLQSEGTYKPLEEDRFATRIDKDMSDAKYEETGRGFRLSLSKVCPANFEISYNNITIKVYFMSAHTFRTAKAWINGLAFNSFHNRPFARWRHLTTKTRILQGFALLCKLGVLLFKPRWDYQTWIWKENSKRILVIISKMTPSCKWPIKEIFTKIKTRWNGLNLLRQPIVARGHQFFFVFEIIINIKFVSVRSS